MVYIEEKTLLNDTFLLCKSYIKTNQKTMLEVVLHKNKKKTKKSKKGIDKREKGCYTN